MSLRRPRSASSLACIAVLLGAATSCSNYGTCRPRADCLAVRQRPATARSESALAAQYAEEHDYIRERRSALAPRHRRASGPVPEKLVALALSGGGIRSASFSLGVLQALADLRIYDEVDYLSAVSGGGYMAGWLQAHLGADPGALVYDRLNYEVTADSADALLDGAGDHIGQLRERAEFLNYSSSEGLPAYLGAWAWRYPLYLATDVGLHWKSAPWQNRLHIFDIYRQGIEETYFRGETRTPVPAAKAALALADINPAGRADRTPYLILNGRLANGPLLPSGEARADNFEFTRDFVGSDALGYVPTRGFARPVAGVFRDRASGRVQAVQLARDYHASEPFRLSSAVAASGAALEPWSLLPPWLRRLFAHELGVFSGRAVQALRAGAVSTVNRVIAAPFNLNLGYETWNFARADSSVLHGAVPFVRMLTTDRLRPFPAADARWLVVTDGGHYENLGVVPLLRRGARCIISVDASFDPEPAYGDLAHTRGLARALLGLELAPGPLGGNARGAPAYRLGVESSAGPAGHVLYLKPVAAGTPPHLRAPRQGSVEEIVAQEAAEQAREEARIEQARFAAYAERLDASAAVLRSELDAIYTAYRDARASAELRLAEIARELERDQRALESTRAQLVAARAALRDALPAVSQPAQPQNGPSPLEGLVDELQELYGRRKLRLELVRGLASGEPRNARVARLLELERAYRGWLERVVARTPEQAAALDAITDRAAEQHLAQRILSERVRSFPRHRQELSKIAAYRDANPSYPNDPTTLQSYTWEQFEAYRMLGYFTALTYLTGFDADTCASTLLPGS
jgi:predicted acylesterase/phospholipase RssA